MLTCHLHEDMRFLHHTCSRIRKTWMRSLRTRLSQALASCPILLTLYHHKPYRLCLVTWTFLISQTLDWTLIRTSHLLVFMDRFSNDRSHFRKPSRRKLVESQQQLTRKPFSQSHRLSKRPEKWPTQKFSLFSSSSDHRISRIWMTRAMATKNLSNLKTSLRMISLTPITLKMNNKTSKTSRLIKRTDRTRMETSKMKTRDLTKKIMKHTRSQPTKIMKRQWSSMTQMTSERFKSTWKTRLHP